MRDLPSSPAIKSTPTYPSAYMDAVEQELRSVIESGPLPLTSPRAAELRALFEYHLGWADPSGQFVRGRSGKKLRPLICMLSFEAVRGTRDEQARIGWDLVTPAAAAIELVHNFSLIHDDIEDNSTQRHGRPTVWKVWGTAQGINAGDALFVLARLALDRLAPLVTPQSYADVLVAFDTATLALTQGQFLDLCFESRRDVSVEDYFEMVRGKTCALIGAAAKIGARIATEDIDLLTSFAEFGENFGIAFQIADDILGIWGNPSITGKPAGDDILAKKKSLPLLAALQEDASGEIARYLQGNEASTEAVERITLILDGLRARERAVEMAGVYVNRAEASLRDSGLENQAVDRLVELARGAVDRIR